MTRCRLAASSDEQRQIVKNCLLKHFEYNLSVFAPILSYTLQFAVLFFFDTEFKDSLMYFWFYWLWLLVKVRRRSGNTVEENSSVFSVIRMR